MGEIKKQAPIKYEGGRFCDILKEFYCMVSRNKLFL